MNSVISLAKINSLISKLISNENFREEFKKSPKSVLAGYGINNIDADQIQLPSIKTLENLVDKYKNWLDSEINTANKAAFPPEFRFWFRTPKRLIHNPS